MAGLFASAAVQWALDKVSSLLPAAASNGQGELEDLRMLERTMRRIHATLEDAEQHWNIREESAKLRLQELKDLAYDAEDVVEEYEYEVNRFKVEAFEYEVNRLQELDVTFERLAVVHGGAGGGSSKRKRLEVHEEHYSIEAGMVPVPSELADRARKLIERFNEIKDYSDSFNLSENDGERWIVPDIHSVRQTSSFVYAPRILGRDQDKERVITRLFSGEGSRVGGRISVLAIVGMGGLGKTTLAQLVYNDPRVRQSFDLCAWVCVSEWFDVQNITRKIISSLTRNNCDHVQSGHLQGLLAEQIQEKRVFLVLDDVWNERSDCWEMLCMPMFTSTRCDIVVTTRNEVVARLVQTMPFYNPQCLNAEESWSLFKQAAFVEQENVSPATNLVEIGKRVAEKCKGLPLALKTVGSILRFENNEKKWREVLESELWDLQQSQQEVLPALELSYRYMPIYLKRCFVALSLYPKALYLDEEMVVWLWKLLGLLHSDGIYNMDEIGNLYFNELVERSLLQSGIHEESVMHDLVHDLACFLAGEEFFRLDSEKYTEVPQGARYVSIVAKEQCNKSIQISNASKSLRAIIIEGYNKIKNPEELFLNCNKFRVVHIEGGSIAKVLLDFMGGMKLLRHLSLARCQNAVLSNSISHLFNLQTLDIGSHNLHGIGRLANLHTLPEIHLCKCGCFNIRELSNMNKVRKLCIYGLCNVSSIRDAEEAYLHRKKNLEILELDFGGPITCEQTKRAVSQSQILEILRPHCQSLKVLRIRNFNHGNYPSWLSNASFPNLTELELYGCQSHHFPTLGELPALKLLMIGKMEHVEHIGREFSSHDQKFSSLVSLCFEDMCRLSEWSEVGDGEFPRLEILDIRRAIALRSLPSVPILSLHKFTLYNCSILFAFPRSATLQELSISRCERLKQLPALPSLRSLYLDNCPSLVTFGHFPLLTVLHLSGRFKNEILPRLVNSHQMLEEFSVWSLTMTSICLEPQSLPSLRKLVLCCPNLQYCDALDRLTSLKTLNTRGSPQLHVPHWLRSQLEELYTS
ncbi:hypothetical protein ABZP36_009629 [Zizania latifolia]